MHFCLMLNIMEKKKEKINVFFFKVRIVPLAAENLRMNLRSEIQDLAVKWVVRGKPREKQRGKQRYRLTRSTVNDFIQQFITHR